EKECHRFAAWRRCRTGLSISRRWEISNLLRRQFEHCDGRVILPVRAKREPLSIRRPARRVALAGQSIELLYVLLSVKRSDPEMFLGRPDHILSVRRNL